MLVLKASNNSLFLNNIIVDGEGHHFDLQHHPDRETSPDISDGATIRKSKLKKATKPKPAQANPTVVSHVDATTATEAVVSNNGAPRVSFGNDDLMPSGESEQQEVNTDKYNLFKTHLLTNDPLPQELYDWHKSKVPDTSNLDGAQDLINIASGSKEDKQLENTEVNYCPADCKAVNDQTVMVGVLGDFPPGKQNLHLHGVLAGKEGSLPQNPTVKTFTKGVIDINEVEYDARSKRITPIFMNSFMWTNALPYDLDFDIIQSDPELYKAFIEKSKPHMVRYTQALMKKYPNIKVWIVLGGPAYKIVTETGVIPQEMLVQDGPVVHPSKLCRSKGAWMSEVITFYKCISRAIARLLDEPSNPVNLINVRNIFNVRENNVYDAMYDGETVFSAPTKEVLIELIRTKAKVGVTESNFPNLDEISSPGGAQYKRLTIVARHYTQHDLDFGFGVRSTSGLNRWKQLDHEIRSNVGLLAAAANRDEYIDYEAQSERLGMDPKVIQQKVETQCDNQNNLAESAKLAADIGHGVTVNIAASAESLGMDPKVLQRNVKTNIGNQNKFSRTSQLAVAIGRGDVDDTEIEKAASNLEIQPGKLKKNAQAMLGSRNKFTTASQLAAEMRRGEVDYTKIEEKASKLKMDPKDLKKNAESIRDNPQYATETTLVFDGRDTESLLAICPQLQGSDDSLFTTVKGNTSKLTVANIGEGFDHRKISGGKHAFYIKSFGGTSNDLEKLRKTTIHPNAATIIEELLEQAGLNKLCVVTDTNGVPLARHASLSKATSAGAKNGGFPGTTQNRCKLTVEMIKAAMTENDLGFHYTPVHQRSIIQGWTERYIKLIDQDEYDELEYLDKDKPEEIPAAKTKSTRKRASNSKKKTTSRKNNDLSDNVAPPKKKRKKSKKA